MTVVVPSPLVDVICDDAGDLRELPLKRLGHRGRHGLGAGAGKLGRDLDGRKIDLRQRRNRQARIGDQADKQETDHHQRGRDRDLMKGAEMPPLMINPICSALGFTAVRRA